MDGYKEYLKNKVQYFEKDEVPTIPGFAPLIEQQYDFAHTFTNAYTYAVRKGKSYLISRQGELFDCAPFTDEIISEKYILYKRNNKFGLSSISSKFYLPTQYEKIKVYGSTILAFSENKIESYYNEKLIAAINASNADILEDAILIYNEALCDLRFQPLTIGDCFVIRPKCEGMTMVQRGGKIGFADEAGNIVIPPEYSSAMSFSQGLARVGKGNAYKLIDKKGITVFEQNEVIPFSKAGNYIGFAKQSFFGFMDSSFQIITPPKFQNVFQDRAFNDFVIDLSYTPQLYSLKINAYVLDEFEEIIPAANYFICKKSNGKFDLYDKDLNIVIAECDLLHFKEGILTVFKDGYCYFYKTEEQL